MKGCGGRLGLGLALGLAAIVAAVLPVSAAKVSTGTGECGLRLEGAVTEGDAQQMAAALADLPEGKTTILCLNSPGGNYLVAIEIIELILGTERTIATMVPRGAECYSACAFVFLAGHKDKEKEQADRRLDARATLGFHGPYIKPGDADYDAQLVPKAYRQGIKSIGVLIGLSRGQLFPESLLAIGLEKGPDDFFLVDELQKAGKWNISVTGTKPQRLTSRKAIFRACANLSEWAGSISPEDDVADTPIPFKNGKYRVRLPGFGDEAHWTCVADVYDGGDKGHFLWLHWASDKETAGLPPPDALEKAVKGARNAGVPPGTPVWFALDGATKLDVLAAGAR